jgi:hypothetical protein
MYRHWLYLILLSSIMNVVAARLVYGGDIKNIRRDFNLAMDDEGKANQLFNQLTKLNPSAGSLEYAYWGATEALLAKHAFNPFSKLNYVKRATEKLNKAIALNGNNIEIRYMRFSVESAMPTYLGYSKHVNEDKKVIIDGLIGISALNENKAMYKFFASNILKSSFCNNAEKKLLSDIVVKLSQ